MPWGKCDDSFYDHPKVRALPVEVRNDACGLYWRAISFANRHLTDGRVTLADVSSLDGTVESALALVRVRLWDRAGKAFRVHDFLGFNKSRVQVLKEREQKAAAGRQGGIASGQSRGSKGEPEMKHSASVSVELPSRPVPSDSPPKPPRGGRALKRDKGVEGLGTLIGRIAAESKTT